MNPYTLFGGLLLLIAAAFGGANVGKKLERQVWQKERLLMGAEHEKQIKAEFRQYATDVALQQAKARKASEDHEKALQLQDQKHRDLVADIQRSGGLRIRAPAACRQGPPAVGEAAGTSGLDEGPAGTIRLPADVERGLFELAGRADKMSEQLRALQGWVRDNGMYGPSTEEVRDKISDLDDALELYEPYLAQE